MTPQLKEAIKIVKKLNSNEQDELVQFILGEKQTTELAQEISIPEHLVIWQAPIFKAAEQQPDFWPEDETADEINNFIHQLRQESFTIDQDIE